MHKRAVWAFVIGILAAMLCTTGATAGPLEAPLLAQLLKIFDDYNKAVAAGKLDEALALRSQEAQAEIKKDVTDADKRKEFVEMSGMMTPDTLEVTRSKLSADGNKASIVTLAKKKIPETQKDPNGPPPGSIQSAVLTLNFVKEGGQWKYDEQVFGMDPAKVVACKNDKFEPLEAYDQDKSVNAGGPIVRVDFQPEYTLVVFRVLDEETCSYLPDKATIEKAGFNTALLVPDAIVEMDGFPHKTDKQKMWVDHISVHKDE